MKYRFLAFILLLSYAFIFLFSAHAKPFYFSRNSLTGSVEKCIVDLRLNNAGNLRQAYQTMVSDLPAFISECLEPQRAFTVIVPNNLEGVGPLEKNAPFVEGARTAIAWLKAYEAYFKKNNSTFYVIKDSDFHESLSDYESWQPDIKQRAISMPLDGSWDSRDTQKKCCLITGGAGFIGSHLAKKLLAHGFQVIAVDNLICSTGQNIADLEDNPDFLFIRHDVSEPFCINTHLDYVIHAASIPSPADYYKMPVQTMQVGIMGTLHALELAAAHDAVFLFASTSEVYGDPEIHPQVESYAGNVDYTSCRAPYDQSKRGAETLIQLFVTEHPLDVRIARIFNTYGPGMRLHDGRVVTNFTAAILENKAMQIYGDGTQTRSLCYIDDLVEGLYRLLTAQNLPAIDSLQERVFNLGNPTEYTILEIAHEFQRLAKKYLPYPAHYQLIENKDKADPRKRKPDISRARHYLGFNPTVPFEQGVEKTFLYFMHQRKNFLSE